MAGTDSNGSQRVAEAARLAAILAALAILGPFSVDSYLPAFPDIRRSLGATDIEVQQTLTAYLASFAVMMLWHGALSDALGRRVVVLISLGVFAVASLGCASAHSVPYLWAFRMLQGVSAGAGVVIGRAMIRDRYRAAEAERLLSLVTMIFAIGPAIAPILGGWIVTLLDWRSIFLFLFGYTLVLFALCWYHLPETLPQAQRTALKVGVLWRHYVRVFGDPRFQGYAAALSFNFAGLFIYVAAAPVFLIRDLHLTAEGFGWQFIPSVAGIFLGALVANRFAGRVARVRTVGLGFALLVGAAAVNLTYHSLFLPALPWSVIPLFFYTAGMSIAAPGLTLTVLDLYPGVRGLAASCQSFTQTLLGAAVAGLIAPALSVSARALAAGQLGFALLGVVAWAVARRLGPAPGIAAGPA